MRFEKDILAQAANYALGCLQTEDNLKELKITNLQINAYHQTILEKFLNLPVENLSTTMVYRVLTNSFKQLKDRKNLVTESYAKLYCNYFFKKLKALKKQEANQ
jgi:hypothetical protein